MQKRRPLALLVGATLGTSLAGCALFDSAKEAVVSDWIQGVWSCEVPNYVLGGLVVDIEVGEGTWAMTAGDERTASLVAEDINEGTWGFRFGDLDIQSEYEYWPGGPFFVIGLDADTIVPESGTTDAQYAFAEESSGGISFDTDGDDVRITQITSHGDTNVIVCSRS